jgi:hypothetical protein
VVRDDIVQLAGDLCPLGGRGAGGLAVQFRLGALGAALGRSQVRPLRAAEDAGRTRGEEDKGLRYAFVRSTVAGGRQRDGDADDGEGYRERAPEPAAAVDDRVERDRWAQRERRGSEAELIVGDPGAADDDHREDRVDPAPGKRDSLHDDQDLGQPQRMQLRPERQQRQRVDDGQYPRQGQVLDPFLAPRRQLRHPRGQHLREPGDPRGQAVHDLIVRREPRPGISPAVERGNRPHGRCAGPPG